MNWHTIDYLQAGSSQQRAVYEVLVTHRILSLLAEFDPVLVGTFPLDIAVTGSDLDIICDVHDADYFLNLCRANFAEFSQYTSYQTVIGGVASCVVRFVVDGYEVEIFGQPIPTRQQNGYRHMCVEARLLTSGGTAFKKKVISAKQAGIKTEPAFAELLQLPGDPYQALLTMEHMTDEMIDELPKRCGWSAIR